MCKVLMVIALCAGAGQALAMASTPAEVKPIKRKMVKTDFASRGKPWEYKVGTRALNWSESEYKNVKNDVTISFRPGVDELVVCPFTGVCKETVLTDAYASKDNLIAIDKDGNALPKTAAEIKQLIEGSKKGILGIKVKLNNPANIKVLIQKNKFPVPFTVKSAPQATGDEYTDVKVVREGNLVGDNYVVDLMVEKIAPGKMKTGSFIRINDKPGKQIIIRNRPAITRKNRNQKGEMKDAEKIAAIEDTIEDGSIVRMGTNENVFFVMPKEAR